MATGNIIGQIKITVGLVQIVGKNGVVRDALNDESIYEGDQILSVDDEAVFTVKYTALDEESSYEGIFRVLVDGSVVAGADAMESITNDENLMDALDTAAGEEGADGSSAYIPTDVVATSSVQDFGRGANAGPNGLGGVDNGAEFSDDLNDFAPTAEDATNVGQEDNRTDVTGQLVGADRDGSAFEFVLVDGLEEGEGSLVLNSNGTYSYNVEGDFQDLAEGETRDVTFTYKTVETTTIELYESEPATVTITVTGTNDQPEIENVDANYAKTILTGNIVQLGTENDNYDENDDEGDISGEDSSSIDYRYFSHDGGQLSIDVLTEFGYDQFVDVNGDGEQTALDSYIYLYRNTGSFDNDSLVEYNDDSDADGTPDGDDGEADGSVYSYDSYLEFNDLPTGDYVLVIGAFSLSTQEIQAGVNYDNSYEGPYKVTISNDSGKVYETHDTDQGEDGDTVDDALNKITGTLSVYDVDTTDTHTFEVAPNTTTEVVAPTGVTINDVEVDIYAVDEFGQRIEDGDTQTETAEWQYEIKGDFTQLAAGETATLTFDYVAIDDHDDNTAGDSGNFDAPNESDTSEPATITLTITGTNDQPIVDNIIVETAIFETLDDVYTTFDGNLATAQDDDVNDTHVYHLVGEDSYYGEDDIDIIEADVDSVVTNSLGEDVDLGITATVELDEETGDYTISGDFNALADGETATVTFEYYAMDDSGAGTETSNDESSISEPKLVTLTITGTNDQPVASDASRTTNEDTTLDITADSLGVYDVDTTDTHTFVQPSSVELGDGIVNTYVAEHGSVEISADSGTVVYTPDEDYAGEDSFYYEVTDHNGGTDIATINVHVEAVADMPDLSYEILAAGEVNQLTVRVTATQVDLDGSEFIDRILLDGLPEGVQVSEALYNTIGEPDQIVKDFIITLPKDVDTSFDLSVTAISQEESNGVEASSTIDDISITYDATQNNSTNTFEAEDRSMWSSDEAFIFEDDTFIGFENSHIDARPTANFGVGTAYADIDIDYTIGLQSSLYVSSGDVDASVEYSVGINSYYNQTIDWLSIETTSFVMLENSYFNTYSPTVEYSLDLVTQVDADLEFGVDIDIAGIPAVYSVYVPATYSPGVPAVTFMGETITPAIPPVQLTPAIPSVMITPAIAGYSWDGNSGDSADFAFDESVTLLELDADSINLFGLEVETPLTLDLNYASIDLAIPQFDTESEVSGDYLESTGSDDFLILGIDVDEMLATGLGVPNPFSQGVDFGPVSVGYDLINYVVEGSVGIGQDFTMDFGDINALIEFEDGEQFAFDLGDTIDIYSASLHDANGDGDIDYSVTLTPYAEFSNDIFLALELSHTLEVLGAEATVEIPLFDDPSYTIGPAYEYTAPLAGVDIPLTSITFDFDLGSMEMVYTV